MKKILFATLLIWGSTFAANSQFLRINNGVSISSLHSNHVDLLEGHLYSYTFSGGIDYFTKTYFSLSSEIGYITLGGSDKFSVGASDFHNKITIREKKNYLQLNTTFRVKTPKKQEYLYFGVGPHVNILLSDKNPNSSIFETYTFNRLLYGIKTEIGSNLAIHEKLYVGLNFSFLYNLNSYAKTELNTVKSSAFSFTAMIGYKLY